LPKSDLPYPLFKNILINSYKVVMIKKSFWKISRSDFENNIEEKFDENHLHPLISK